MGIHGPGLGPWTMFFSLRGYEGSEFKNLYPEVQIGWQQGAKQTHLEPMVRLGLGLKF